MKSSSLFFSMSRTHQLLISTLCIALFIVFLLPSDDASASKNTNVRHDLSLQDGALVNGPFIHGPLVEKLKLGFTYPLDLNLSSNSYVKPKVEPVLNKTSIKVISGDSLSLIFDRANLSATTLHHINYNSGEDAKLLRKIHPGDVIDFYTDTEGKLLKLIYAPSKLKVLTVIKDPNTSEFSSSLKQFEIETRYKFARADIGNIFWNAGSSAGLEDGLIMELAAIFGWDVDFALDIRSGDSFSVLYEQRFINARYIGYGNIIAAEFINQGEVFQAARHTDGHYYAPDGKSMRKTFLRAPVHFKYISSSFNPRRLHPVTGKVKAHRGIDYAARVGTPVMSAGDGKVLRSGYNKYNGNFIFIKHSERYVTKYLHLQKRYVNSGQRVKQGKIIGTLGGTGRVTGPHLHYEFLVNGVHKNPRTVTLPQADDINKSEKADFIAQAQHWLTQLKQSKRVMLAVKPDPVAESSELVVETHLEN